MSATDTQQQAQEPSLFDPTSSIEINTTAKGTYQWKIKVRSQSNNETDVREAFALAIELEQKAAQQYAGKTGAA